MSGTKRKINGATVRALRVAVGIKGIDFAARVGISSSTLTRIEQGARDVAPDTLRRIADALGVEIDAISYPALAA